MFKNYFKTALRNIWHNKTHAFINVFGLALSLSVCLLIILVIMDQTSYDNFHEKKNRIYRVITTDQNFNFSLNRFATSPPALGDKLKKDYPQIDNIASISRSSGGEMEYNGKIIDMTGLSTDAAFFNVFSFPVTGDRDELLNEPGTIVIKETAAEKYFGNTNPLGKSIHSERYGELTIAGVIPETKQKSHIKFDYLLSSSTLEEKEPDWNKVYNDYNYIVLMKNADPSTFPDIFSQLEKEHYSADPEHSYSFKLQALSDITPGPLLGNEIGFFLPEVAIIVLMILALIVIFSAAINYTNLSIARALSRVKEVGLRKVVGARRDQIIMQFLIESVFISLVAFVFAYIILQYLKPAFHNIGFMSLLEIDPQENLKVYMAFLIFTILVGVVAGLSPSLIMSKFRPAYILKGFGFSRKILSGQGLRKILVITQFVVSIVLIISIILIYRQTNYFLNSDHGFRQKAILNIELQENEQTKVADYIASFPSVEKFTFTSIVPGLGNRNTTDTWKKDKEDKFELNYLKVDQNYIDVMDLNLIAGTNFPGNVPTQNEKFVIVNQQALDRFNFDTPGEAINKNIYIDDSLSVQIVGVIEDFNFVSKMEKIKPFALRLKPQDTRYASLLVSGNLRTTYNQLKKEWKSVDERHEFKAKWMDEQVEEYYMMFGDILYIVGFIALLAVVVACLGLLGMASYSVKVRTKEIGIRKALGADMRSIIYTLSASFLKIILVATLIALPLAYYGNNLWLNSFPYKVNFGFVTLIIGAGVVLLLSMTIVFSQGAKASTNNPVDALRYE